eukprot:COSAG06_NODE_10832_length_1609_cov_3.033775_2_plen_224_part_00
MALSRSPCCCVARARASRRLRALSAHLILPPADDATAAARAVAGLAGRPNDYRGLLLLAYEEELMGEILFADIATKLADPGQAQKMHLMSQVERHTADAVRPLLQRHGLTPRTDEELHRLVLSATSQDPPDWQEWMERALEGGDGPSLQEYVDEFLELEAGSSGGSRDLGVFHGARAGAATFHAAGARAGRDGREAKRSGARAVPAERSAVAAGCQSGGRELA